MKTRAYLSGGLGMRRFAFVVACLLITGAGWFSKCSVDRLGEMAEELQSDFLQPSPVYLRNSLRRQVAHPGGTTTGPQVSKQNPPD